VTDLVRNVKAKQTDDGGETILHNDAAGRDTAFLMDDGEKPIKRAFKGDNLLDVGVAG
jgi:hypothetical protein